MGGGQGRESKARSINSHSCHFKNYLVLNAFTDNVNNTSQAMCKPVAHTLSSPPFSSYLGACFHSRVLRRRAQLRAPLLYFIFGAAAALVFSVIPRQDFWWLCNIPPGKGPRIAPDHVLRLFPTILLANVFACTNSFLTTEISSMESPAVTGLGSLRGWRSPRFSDFPLTERKLFFPVPV